MEQLPLSLWMSVQPAVFLAVWRQLVAFFFPVTTVDPTECSVSNQAVLFACQRAMSMFLRICQSDQNQSRLLSVSRTTGPVWFKSWVFVFFILNLKQKRSPKDKVIRIMGMYDHLPFHDNWANPADEDLVILPKALSLKTKWMLVIF